MNDLISRAAAIAVIKTCDDSAAVEALWQRLCCSGVDCGCRGATVEEYLCALIKAIPAAQPAPLPDDPALDWGKVEPLTDMDRSNIVAHLSYELEPSGEMPTFNSVMMDWVHQQNAITALRAEVARLKAQEVRVKALEDALRAIQKQAMTTRGDQAYREFPKFAVNTIRTALEGGEG